MPASCCTELSEDARKTLLTLVWQVLDKALAGGELQLPPAPDVEALLQPAACFVSLHQNGELRGCIGSLYATEPLWLNACKNAYASGFKDWRFEPLTQQERSGLELEISILSTLTPMENEGEPALIGALIPGRDGLLLDDAGHRAVFLPAVWNVLPEPKRFVEALKRKGGWPRGYWNRDIAIHRFTTEVVK